MKCLFVCSMMVAFESVRVWLVTCTLVWPREGVSIYRPTKDTLVYGFYHFVGGTTECPPVNILKACNMENIHQLCITHYLVACMLV